MIFITIYDVFSPYTIGNQIRKDNLGGVFMSAQDLKKQGVQVDHGEVNSLKGTLFSTVVFVGGGILFFILLLFYFFITRAS